MNRDIERLTVTVDEACTLLHLSRPFMLRMLNEGRIPGAHKLGHKWVIGREGIERWLAGHNDAVPVA